jgi:hypothetical protein
MATRFSPLIFIFLVKWSFKKVLNHFYGIRFRLSSLSNTRFCAAVFRANYVAPRTLHCVESRLDDYRNCFYRAESLFDNGEWILGVFLDQSKPAFEKRPYFELEDSKMLF